MTRERAKEAMTKAIKVLFKSLREIESVREAKIERIRRSFEPLVKPLIAKIIRQKKLAYSR